MKHYDAKNRLIERTISVLANEGLDKTTTKAIVSGTDINEAYIYRFFDSKEDLLSKTFSALDEELYAVAMNGAKVMYDRNVDYKMRCEIYFMNVWRFLLGNRDKCLAYIRYYYSPYFRKYSSAEHRERYVPLVAIFKEAFRAEANTWMILNHILNVLLDFSTKVYDGEVPDNDDTAEHVFQLIYSSVFVYFNK